MIKNDYSQYIGQKFGRLTILEIEGNRCKCVCDCGNLHSVRIYNLLRGNTKSCGCGRSVFAKERWQRYRDTRVCSFCGAPSHYANGLCKNCYARKRRKGYADLEPKSQSKLAYEKHRIERQKEKKEYIESLTPNTDLGREMQELWANGMTLREIAAKYGYSKSWVHILIRGEEKYEK